MICARRYGWPPSVTRAQTERDLSLLAMAEQFRGG